MPTQTDHQLAADALHEAFLVNLIAEAEALTYQDEGSGMDDSLSSSSGTDSSSQSSSSEDEALQPTSEVLLEVMGDLYSQHYLNAREIIIKDKTYLFSLFWLQKGSCHVCFLSFVTCYLIDICLH